jgi:hypothetical protein
MGKGDTGIMVGVGIVPVVFKSLPFHRRACCVVFIQWNGGQAEWSENGRFARVFGYLHSSLRYPYATNSSSGK